MEPRDRGCLIIVRKKLVLIFSHADFESNWNCVRVQVLMKVLANVESCVLVGGCVLAVDLLTVVHEASERTAIPLQSNLIAATSFMEPLKEWMYTDKDGAQV